MKVIEKGDLNSIFEKDKTSNERQGEYNINREGEAEFELSIEII